MYIMILMQLLNQKLNHTKKHWHFLYKHRRRSTNASTKQIVVGQVLTVIISVIAGLWLDNVKYSLVAFAGALILLPGIVNLCGSLAGALGAKINHLIEENPKRNTTRILIGSTTHALIISLLTGLLVGIVGGVIGELYFEADLFMMVKLMLLTMLLVGVVIYPIVAALVLIFRGLKMNPDNLVGPAQSSLVDLLSVVMIALAIEILA